MTKNDYHSNINARKRATNRAKTAAKGKTKVKTDGGGKLVGLDAGLGWATNLLVGGQFDIYVDSKGEVLTKILLGKTKQQLKQSIILLQTKYQRGRRTSFPRIRGDPEV